MKTFAIYFDSLTKEAQKELCEEFGTDPEDENWESIPLCILEREDEVL